MIDELILGFDRALRLLAGTPLGTRPTPAESVADAPLSDEEREHACGLMRVNHSGEVCAQALYYGQAVGARGADTRARLLDAARDEEDHLVWTRQRVAELGGRTSVLDPLWYAGSFAIGTLASFAGDRWSLGFIVETERQVEEHLGGHLDRLPAADRRSRAVVDAMRTEEARHATAAREAGGADLPLPVRLLMRATAKVMTSTAYRI